MAKVTPISEHFLRTTNIIERCFVEVRRRTRPMACFVNVQSVDWKNRTLKSFYTSSLTSPSAAQILGQSKQKYGIARKSGPHHYSNNLAANRNCNARD
jgi:transposase-like protein